MFYNSVCIWFFCCMIQQKSDSAVSIYIFPSLLDLLTTPPLERWAGLLSLRLAARPPATAHRYDARQAWLSVHPALPFPRCYPQGAVLRMSVSLFLPWVHLYHYFYSFPLLLHSHSLNEMNSCSGGKVCTFPIQPLLSL